MKNLILSIFLLSVVTANAQIPSIPLYMGEWAGTQAGFKSPYIVVINDSNLLLIRKNVAKGKVLRQDTLQFIYQIKQISNGYEFSLSTPKALKNKDKTITAQLLFEETKSKYNQLCASFSVDFEEGNKELNTLKLVKQLDNTNPKAAVSLKLYYWNKPFHQFNNILTEAGGNLFDSIVNNANLDTNLCVKVKPDEIVKYTSKSFLKNHHYKYYQYIMIDGSIQKNMYEAFNGYDTKHKPYCIISYSSNFFNLDLVSLYLIE
jgi:hypothetical protein